MTHLGSIGGADVGSLPNKANYAVSASQRGCCSRIEYSDEPNSRNISNSYLQIYFHFWLGRLMPIVIISRVTLKFSRYVVSFAHERTLKFLLITTNRTCDRLPASRVRGNTQGAAADFSSESYHCRNGVHIDEYDHSQCSFNSSRS